MESVDGKLINQVGRLEKNLPRANSEGYIVPTDEEKKIFANIVTNLRDNKLEDALVSATDNAYELLWYADNNDDNAVSYLLRESDPSQKGWGLYVFRVGTDSNIIIEAPHPVYDEGTPSIAVNIYRALDARAVLVAGAHRDANRDHSADAAHDPQNIFQAIHEAELQQSINSMGSVIILQIHGFAASKHPAYPHVIVSYEHGKDINPVDLVKGQQIETKIFNALQDNGIKAGTCGGGEWRDLCGSTNIQSSLMTQGIFIHIELDDSIRQNSKRFLSALVDALGFAQ